jgi:hypothetical protein
MSNKPEPLFYDSFEDFMKFVETVKAKVRQGMLTVDNTPAYIVGTYQKKAYPKFS